MYRDNTLIPSEAIRLLALGLLAEAPRSYAALARDVREFLHLAVGPSLDLVAPPLELLKIEGLVEASSTGSEGTLTLSATGQAELKNLLNSNLRTPTTDISKLIIALKVRFLSQLPLDRQELQLEMMLEVYERVALRLRELKERTPGDNMAFLAWLDSEIAKAEHQRDWAKERLGRKA